MELITGKTISRRTVLRGVGAALALPLLESMVPAGLSGRAVRKPAHRFLAYYTPNGQAMPYWTPKGVGADFELSAILEPLAPFKDQLIAFSGLRGSWESPHYGSSTCFLSGLPGDEAPTSSSGIWALPSIDQLMAREFERETQLGSLQLGLDGAPMAGSCAVLNCIYTDTISWRSREQPLPMENRPRVVFETLFGDAGSTARSARERRLSQQGSIMDSVMEALGDLKRQLGPQDDLKLDQYFDGVRDSERRIQMAESQLDLELPARGPPPPSARHRPPRRA